MADPIVEELNALFAPASATELEPDVLAELQSIMRLHSIPPQELFYKWESYSMKMGADDMKLDIETSRALKQDVQDGLERESRRRAHARTADRRPGTTPRNTSNNSDVFGILDSLMPNTPRAAPGSATNGAKRKINQYQSPSISRAMQEPASSPPDFKPPYKPGEREFGGP